MKQSNSTKWGLLILALLLLADQTAFGKQRGGPPFDPASARGGLPQCKADLNQAQTDLELLLQGTCGNGIAELHEACDGADLHSATCATASDKAFGTLACTESCALDTSGCTDERFTDNQDGTVTDNANRLVWLQDSECFETRTWQDASDAIEAFNKGTLENNCENTTQQTDWRLPSIEELVTLIDYSKVNPALGGKFQFSGAPPLYWSSTPFEGSPPPQAWAVGFDIGVVINASQSAPFRVRPVRGGQ